MADEIWKEIPGTDGRYEASSLGRVRSLDHTVMRKNGSPLSIQGRVLSQHINHAGYLTVPFAGRMKLAHRLVAAAFLAPDPSRPHINHLNGLKKDNRPENLAWCTIKENNHHARDLGLGTYRPPHIAGEAHYRAKLTAEQVRSARIRRAAGEGIADLAREHGVDRSTMRSAIIGQHWACVP